MATKKATTKATEVKEVKEVKVEAPKTEVKEVKKAPAKKAATTKTTTAKKETVKKETVITVQYLGNEVSVASVEEKVKAAFVAEGNKASSIKTLNIYVKPEEFAAYYVINGDFSGRVDLF